MNHNNAVRAFFAIPIPKEIKDYLREIIKNFQNEIPGDSIKWVDPDNIHITLQFLGDISQSLVETLGNKLEESQFSSFEVEINQIGAFPSIFKPRVIWVGISKSEMLNMIAIYIRNLTNEFHIETDEKPFSPHLTIARIKPGSKTITSDSLKKLLIKKRVIEPLQFQVTKYCLFQSKLTPKGPIYSVLRSYNLISK